jgi:hypothetical protein
MAMAAMAATAATTNRPKSGFHQARRPVPAGLRRSEPMSIIDTFHAKGSTSQAAFVAGNEAPFWAT